ncbi:MAG TPA: hypothetical protein VMX16_02205 [Terriglobia bacterium]|nr:hypothetical protein [Terriglobia bacterium]
MHKAFLLTAAVVFVPLSLLAQVRPGAEVYTGYSYLNANPYNSRFSLNGWDASFTGFLTSWFGAEADFSDHYGSSPLSPRFVPRFTYLFGPHVSFRIIPRVTPFVHVLAGETSGSAAGLPLGAPCIKGLPCPGAATITQTSFAGVVGGGLDVKLTRHISVRVIQADYLFTNFSGGHQNDTRISAGVVFTLGR